MDWLKIGSLILLVMMAVFIFPRAKYMLKNSPKGSGDDWRTFALVIVGVVLFVFLLIKMV